MGILSLEGMEFFSYHGCFPEEQLTGTRFKVDIHLHLDTSPAEISDDIHQALDYQKIYKLVEAEMAVHSKLIEHVAERILASVCAKYPEIQSAEVKVSKLNPPLGGKVESVSVQLRKPLS